MLLLQQLLPYAVDRLGGSPTAPTVPPDVQLSPYA